MAATPKEASTEVGGTVLTELIFATTRPGTSGDRLLNGPTNDVWLRPWLAYLRKKGVDYHLEAEVVGIDCVDGRIAGVTVSEGGTTSTVTGDYYIAAMPVERMALLLTDTMVAADPILAGIRTLAGDVAWMTGIQFYLDRQVDIIQGHVTYIETPWALTSISQAQFWSKYELADYGDGTVRDILSVDISDWDTPGILDHEPEVECARPDPETGGLISSQGRHRLPADCCTERQIADDVWAQIKGCVNVDGHEVLTDEMLRGWYVDRDIKRVGRQLENAEPLLVNKAGRWAIRPTADTGIPNLFLASDYIRTNTNLATMEAANEAARRAVNGIIDASNSTASNVPGVEPLPALAGGSPSLARSTAVRAGSAVGPPPAAHPRVAPLDRGRGRKRHPAITDPAADGQGPDPRFILGRTQRREERQRPLELTPPPRVTGGQGCRQGFEGECPVVGHVVPCREARAPPPRSNRVVRLAGQEGGAALQERGTRAGVRIEPGETLEPGDCPPASRDRAPDRPPSACQRSRNTSAIWRCQGRCATRPEEALDERERGPGMGHGRLDVTGAESRLRDESANPDLVAQVDVRSEQPFERVHVVCADLAASHVRGQERAETPIRA